MTILSLARDCRMRLFPSAPLAALALALIAALPACSGGAEDASPTGEAAPGQEALTGLIAISSGQLATCALRSDGSPVCWGVASNPPEGERFVDISVDEWVGACGLRQDGTVVCWGDEASAPIPQIEERFTDISRRCGVRKDDGVVACFDGSVKLPAVYGIDERFVSVSARAGACALSETGLSSCPFGASDERYIDVSEGRYLDCAIRLEDGLPVCRGDQTIMERMRMPEGERLVEISAGEGSPFVCALREDGSPLCWGEGQGYPSWTPSNERLRDLSAGWYHVCAIRIEDGSPVCWGAEDPSKDFGQAAPPGGPRLQAALPPDERFMAISVGFASVCALREDGSPVCAGRGADAINAPPPNERFAAISIGALASCGLRQDGSPVCWALGLGGIKPLDPPEGERFTAVSSGAYHACALREDGSPVCWITADVEGESLRINDAPSGERFVSISSGAAHACGLREDGSPVCWPTISPEGNDQAEWEGIQQLFNPPEGEKLTAISSGGSHICGLRADGSPTCWGTDEFGQASPPEGETFAAISSGGFHTCAIRTDGSPVCWGVVVDRLVSRANQGQASPPEGERFAAISSGTFRSCGLREDGTAVCWGNG